jgi:hypothetical protein
MQLIPGWRRTLTHGYSAHAMYLSIGVGLAKECLPYVGEAVPWWFSVGVLTLALALRIIRQKSVSGTVTADVEEI